MQPVSPQAFRLAIELKKQAIQKGCAEQVTFKQCRDQAQQMFIGKETIRP